MRPLSVVAVSAAIVTAFPPTAVADHRDSPDLPRPDNAQHYVDRISVEAHTSTAVIHGIAQLNRSPEVTATLEGSGDVEVYDHYYGTTGQWKDIAGFTYCYIAGDPGECDVFVIKFNLNYFTPNANVGYHRSGGCHELGHTMDLHHRTAQNDTDANSCLRSRFHYQRPNLDAHDIDAINNTF